MMSETEIGDRRLFTIVRAIGAGVSIVTLNALVLLAFFSDASVPRWSVYVLIVLIGALLGLDALLDIAPVKMKRES